MCNVYHYLMSQEYVITKFYCNVKHTRTKGQVVSGAVYEYDIKTGSEHGNMTGSNEQGITGEESFSSTGQFLI